MKGIHRAPFIGHVLTPSIASISLAGELISASILEIGKARLLFSKIFTQQSPRFD
jgi:hypothetical protein